MGIDFCSLSSGSCGNCQYTGTDRFKILIDAGFSGKRIEGLLSSIDVCPKDIRGILVTHEHIDHIRGVGILSRRYDIPIYANSKTWGSMEGIIGDIKGRNIKIIETGKTFELGDMDIRPFSIFHDAIEPVAYCIHKDDVKISIVTDTGWVDDTIKKEIQDSSLYLMESNHDIQMLKEGRYPWYLKKRVLSDEGHLSNRAAGMALSEILKGEGEIVLLGHLSEENNTPTIAYDTVTNHIEDKGINIHRDIKIELTFRGRATRVYNL